MLFTACSSSTQTTVDKLNAYSYAWHYRDIDSTETYARQAYDMASHYGDGRAEALNHLAFVNIVRMKYDEAERQLTDVASLTDNQIELLLSYVQQMRLCQRRSKNREFHEFRERATTSLKRISEERDHLTERQLLRLIYAESELAIVNSTYYYYVGLERQSIEALQAIDLDVVRHDTAQYLNYLYNVGAGGILTEGSPEQIRADEMDYLSRCLAIAQRYHYPYFMAQAKEAMAEHTGNLQLAEEALELFKTYGDVYQTAGAYRTVASCYHAMGNESQALECLARALVDDRIKQAPDLVASIYEQMSVVHAAIDDKVNSDYYRNHYLDLQEQTRQDRELEARAAMLDTAVTQLNWMIVAVLTAIVLLLALLWLFNHLHRKRKEDHQLDDLLEQKNEELAAARLSVERNERRHMEQRAKVSLATGILPLIDRILYAIDHSSSATAHDQYDYIREITDKINEQNDLLTEWIQLRQGELSLHVESFPLQSLFDIVERSKTGFKMKGITLDVSPTKATVKADRVLTLFMINTLADNARKFTKEGGRVGIAAHAYDDYVEISVSDTGQGLSPDELAHIFDHKVSGGHGFGLMNCKGIIEKYRKISRIFSVCRLEAESEVGKGSRFSFCLPLGVRRMVLLFLLACGTGNVLAVPAQQEDDELSRAHIYADSAFFSNINGTFEKTLLFADSCRKSLNAYYLRHHPQGLHLMTRDGDTTIPAEIEWYHDSIPINYQIILDIRNESAVAALALHEWTLYTYNNKVYTQLFKELSADNTLAEYCRTMQATQTNKRIAVILLLVSLVMIVPAYYFLYYRHRLYYRNRRERLQQTSLEMVEDELRRADLEDGNLHVANAVLDNCLSTLKHETMYYPSRIRKLADGDDRASLHEVASYYRDLYSILMEQATGQLERIKLHIRPVTFYGETLLGDGNMLRYLFELLRGKVTVENQETLYVTYRVRAAFASEIDYLIARQIVRDHGEATNRRGCGVVTEGEDVKLILPKYNGQI